MDKRVPIILITGFLGSGKTTLINQILNSSDTKIALIINEFGDIKLESQFIQKQGIPIAELANGCMCCVANSDVPRVVRFLVQENTEIEMILIEASGLSDPDPIHEVIQSVDLNSLVRLGQVMCVIDCVNFDKTRSEHQIVMSQIADADVIILSKVSEAGEEHVKRIESLLQQLTMNTRVMRWDDKLDMNNLLKIASSSAEGEYEHERYDEDQHIGEHQHEHEHKHEHYSEVWFTSTAAVFSREQVEQIFSQLPTEVVRAKGYVNIGKQRFLVQYSVGNLELSHEASNDWKQDTAILLLGKNLDHDHVLGLFEIS